MACNSDRRDDQNNALSSVSTPSMTPSRPPQSPGSKYSSCVLSQRAQRSNPSQAGRKNSWAMVSGTHWSDATIIVKNTLTESPPIPDQPEYAPATLRAFRQLHDALGRAIRVPYFEHSALVGEYDLENVESTATASVRGPDRRMGVDENLGVVISVHSVRDGVWLVVVTVVVVVVVVVLPDRIRRPTRQFKQPYERNILLAAGREAAAEEIQHARKVVRVVACRIRRRGARWRAPRSPSTVQIRSVSPVHVLPLALLLLTLLCFPLEIFVHGRRRWSGRWRRLFIEGRYGFSGH
ncbi:hypothetical protein GGX14DRAFT_647326 [Mycena pura]|uniref:Uncharacterized protein n=1 Tax=Mycena pura TaxID=153505 RepID=A0AAD6V779_9AGAR|nr:hypothetical protein GGX14DRAFT_647326 [Mycena pura]